MTLRQEIEVLRTEIAQLKEGLHLLQNPQRYGPKPGEIPLLDYLKLELSAARDGKERQKLLEISCQALTDAEIRLSAKQAELHQIERDCEAIANEMKAAGEAVLAAEAAYQQALTSFEALASKHQRRWQELNEGSELFQRLGRVDFPGFAMTSCCGILTTDAIARDLK